MEWWSGGVVDVGCSMLNIESSADWPCLSAGLAPRPRRWTAVLLAAFSLLGASLSTGRCGTTFSAPLERYGFRHPAMGTLFLTTFYAPSEAVAEAAARAAFKRIDTLEDIMSDYEADSELMRLCGQPAGKPVSVSADLFDVLEQAQRASKLSDGAFDVTVGPFVRLWRFSRKRGVLPRPAEIAAARQAVGWRKVRLDARHRTVTLLAPKMRLDLGGIAKGYAADQALKVLKARGLDRALVAASGDIAIGDPPPGKRGWEIGVSPIGSLTNGVALTLLLHNAGISTSGDTEQYVEINGVRYSHIVNPATGLGLTERIQVTIVGPNATTTDSLATGVSVLGKKRGLALIDSLPNTAALILTKENGKSQAFPSRRFEDLPRPSKVRGSERTR